MARAQQGIGYYYTEGNRHCWRLIVNGQAIVVKRNSHAARKTAVEERLAQLRKSGGIAVPRSELTVSSYLDQWLDRIVKPNRAYKTWRQYEQVARLYVGPFIGQVKLSRLTSAHGHDMVKGLQAREPKLSPTTIKTAIVVLKKALNDAVRQSPPIIPLNPLGGLQSPKEAPLTNRALRPDATQTLLRSDETGRYVPAMKLLLASGLRRSEAIGLMWTDLHTTPDGAYIEVQRSLEWYPAPKDVHGAKIGPSTYGLVDVKSGKSRRSIALGHRACEALEQIRAQQEVDRKKAGDAYQNLGFILTTETGRPCVERNLSRALDVLLAAHGIPHVSLHGLRKSCASTMARAGTPMHVVQAYLGHESPLTTAKSYLVALREDHIKAASAFD